jgi:hypothetical protein
VLVALTFNPSDSRSRDQEDRGSKPAWQRVPTDPISKSPSPKKAGRVAPGEGPEFKYHIANIYVYLIKDKDKIENKKEIVK